MIPKLSILICRIPERREKYNLLKAELDKQCYGMPVEILTEENEIVANGGDQVGTIRNRLQKRSTGMYTVFIDDDDWIGETFIRDILSGMIGRPDCIVYDMLMTHTGKEIPVKVDRNFLNANPVHGLWRERMPSHVMPVKKSIRDLCPFPDKSFGEDSAHSLAIRLHIKTQHKINKTLYFYRFHPDLSRTHCYNPGVTPMKSDPIVKMDVVMVSDGTNPENRSMTQKAINSIAGMHTNIIVVEKNKEIKYQFCDTIYQPDDFNYNQCLNIGAKFGNAELICFTNNDVMFPQNFVLTCENLIGESDVLSVEDQMGWIPKEMISGFCYVMKRKSYHKLGKLDESYQFWASDNVVSEQMIKHGMKELKSRLQVTHTRSATLKKLSGEMKQRYTYDCVSKFEKDFSKKIHYV